VPTNACGRSSLALRGARVNAQDNKGNTPLHVSAINGDIEISTLLLKKGADKYVRNSDNLTPLQIAIQKNYESLVKLLN